MIGLLIVAACCTIGFTVEIIRLLKLEIRDFRRAWFLRRQERETSEALQVWRRMHAHNPTRETRLKIALGEAITDLIAAVRAGDWETAAAFKYQVEVLNSLLETSVEDVSLLEPSWHRERVGMAAWN